MTLDWFLDLDFRAVEAQAAEYLDHEVVMLSFQREIVFDAAYAKVIIAKARPTIKANLSSMGVNARFRVRYVRTLFVIPFGYTHTLHVHVNDRRMRVEVPMKTFKLPASGTANVLFSASCPECRRCLKLEVEVEMSGS